MNAPESRALSEILPLDQLQVSRTEAQTARRGRYKQADLEALADTIKRQGLLEPILVRKVTPAAYNAALDAGAPMENKPYEIIAGERRYLAAQIAGFTEIHAIARDISDEDLLQVQLIENMQREGMHELEEALGFQALMKPPYSLNAEAVGEKLGKSRRYVHNRLVLLKLTEKARAAFYDDRLNGSTAMVVASVPEYLQDQLLGEITSGIAGTGEPMSYRDAVNHLRKNYQLRLSNAPFDLKAVYDLVPYGVTATLCGACPKRTGAAGDLFDDTAPVDMCMDPKCFAAKRDAAEAIQRGVDDDVNEETEADRILKTAQTGSTKGGAPASPPRPLAQAPTPPSSAGPAKATPVTPKDEAAAEAAKMNEEIRFRIFCAAREKVKKEIVQNRGLMYKEDVWSIASLALEAYDGGDGAMAMAKARKMEAREGAICHAFYQAKLKGDLAELFLLLWETTVADFVDFAPLDKSSDRLIKVAQDLGISTAGIAAEIKVKYHRAKLAKDQAAEPASTTVKKSDKRSPKAPATTVKSAGAAAAETAGYWRLADLQQRVPRDGKTNANGIYETVLVLRYVDSKFGSTEIHLAGDGKKYAYGWKFDVKKPGRAGSNFEGPCKLAEQHDSLQAALHGFAKHVYLARTNADAKDPVGLALAAGIKSGSGDMIIPKLFRNIGVRSFK